MGEIRVIKATHRRQERELSWISGAGIFHRVGLSIAAAIPAGISPDGGYVVTCRTRGQIQIERETDDVRHDGVSLIATGGPELAVVQPRKIHRVAGIFAIEVGVACTRTT